ncbi:GNAT family N-acetyltransferase [Virgibacillus dakarensis]|nr:GNAT family N-acetyltransferase [Virgibacillus dakarensis]
MVEVCAFPILETDRLILRQVTNDDANSLPTYLSDKDVMKYVGLEPSNSIDDVLDEISWYKSIFEKKTGIRWGIMLKDRGEVY